MSELALALVLVLVSDPPEVGTLSEDKVEVLAFQTVTSCSFAEEATS